MSSDVLRASSDGLIIEVEALNRVSGRALVRAAANGFMLAESEDARLVFRDAITEEVYGRIDAYAACAQVKADDMFEAMVGLAPAPHERFPYEAAGARVRSAAKCLFDEGDVDAFIHALESFIEKEVGAATNIAMAENVEEANS